jgi:hypothetical protein
MLSLSKHQCTESINHKILSLQKNHILIVPLRTICQKTNLIK